VELRSPLPQDLVKALVAVAGAEHSLSDLDPLDFLGFYRDAP
jgi:hypothetical protein